MMILMMMNDDYHDDDDDYDDDGDIFLSIPGFSTLTKRITTIYDHDHV